MNDVFGGRGFVGRSLSLIGITLVVIAVISQYLRHELSSLPLAAALLSCAGWLFLIVLRLGARRASLPLLAVMVGAGGIASSATNGTSLVVAAIAVFWLTCDMRRPVWWGAILGVIAMLVVLASAVFAKTSSLAMLSMEAGIIVAFLGGESRRQARIAETRSRDLIEEQARADVLDARQQLSHDIHDVLAHSLGGLVIQLDAVDALLDAGDTEAAAAKVRDARLLARDGLVEARRAVAALGSPGEQSDNRVAGETIAADLGALVEAHRTLGGSATLVESGPPAEVSAPLAMALRRAVQEGLTNARKHAVGEPVTVALHWRADGVAIEIENPLGASGDEGGGGHGLVGMRERFSALPGGEVTSGIDGGRFVVSAHATLAPRAPRVVA